MCITRARLLEGRIRSEISLFTVSGARLYLIFIELGIRLTLLCQRGSPDLVRWSGATLKSPRQQRPRDETSSLRQLRRRARRACPRQTLPLDRGSYALFTLPAEFLYARRRNDTFRTPTHGSGARYVCFLPDETVHDVRSGTVTLGVRSVYP